MLSVIVGLFSSCHASITVSLKRSQGGQENFLEEREKDDLQEEVLEAEVDVKECSRGEKRTEVEGVNSCQLLTWCVHHVILCC